MPPPIELPDPNTPGLAHDNHAYIAIVSVVVCLLIATPAVAARIYTRKVIVRELWIDDYLTVLAWICMLALGIMECVQTRYGAGAHIWDLPQPDGIMMYLKTGWIGVLMYNLCLFATKAMFFFQYYRIVKGVPTIKFVYTILGILVAAWSISQIVLIAVNCIPVEGNWDTTIAAKCLDSTFVESVLIWMTSVGNLVTDIIILLMPIPVVRNLKLDRRQKVVLLGVFCVGFLTCIISSLRMFALKITVDMSYDMTALLSWSIAEIASGITCACVPTLRPLVGQYFPRWGTQSHQIPKGYQNHSSNRRIRKLVSTGSTTSQNTIYGMEQDVELGRFQHLPGRP